MDNNISKNADNGDNIILENEDNKKEELNFDDVQAAIKNLRDSLTAKTKECEEVNDKYVRNYAEYENFRKRTAKEKEAIYSDAVSDVLKTLLPVLDNLERAVVFSEPEKVFEGIKMIFNQLGDIFVKLGVEEIKAQDEPFNPELHYAVAHEEDPEKGENIVSEVLAKGYKRGDKVIRPSTVKVVN